MSAPAVPATDLVARIDRALAVADRIVGVVGAADHGRTTPCPEWDVRELLAHLVGGVAEMAGMVVAASAGPAPLGDRDSALAIEVDPLDPVAAWPAAVVADRAAWSRPGAIDGAVAFSFATLPGPMAAMVHLTELVVHPIDLAVAIGREDLIDEDLAAGLLRSMHELGGIDGFRVPGMFGPEVAVDHDAAAHRRLLAFVGRGR